MRENLLVAGATGYLGSAVVRAAVSSDRFKIRVIVRDRKRFTEMFRNADGIEIIQADVTHPQKVAGICRDMHYVFSSLGITRQKGYTYEEVDYAANLNLLEDAVENNVKKFIYTSVLNPQVFSGNAMVEAKERFVKALKNSGLNYTILRPTGFFSDMKEFFSMAQRGRVYLAGNGSARLNPIAGSDLAEVALQSLKLNQKELEAGGPEIYSQNEIAETAFQVLNSQKKILHIPSVFARSMIYPLRFFNKRLFTIADFILKGSCSDMVAPCYGSYTLREYFEELNFL